MRSIVVYSLSQVEMHWNADKIVAQNAPKDSPVLGEPFSMYQDIAACVSVAILWVSEKVEAVFLGGVGFLR